MNSQKDFQWYQKAPNARPIEKVVYPAKSFEQKQTTVNADAYSRVLDQTFKSARQQAVVAPTVISIESKTFESPIKVIQVEHSVPQARTQHATFINTPREVSQTIPIQSFENTQTFNNTQIFNNSQTFNATPKQEFVENPIYESASANESTKASLLEETEPLLNHPDSYESTEVTPSLFDQSNFSSLDKEVSFENKDFDSGLQAMKRNSLKLDDLSVLQGDIENGAKFDNPIGDFVNLEYKDDKSLKEQDLSEFNIHDDIIVEEDKWNLYYSRRTPGWIIEQEEQERMERSRRGMDPILLGKWHHVQKEFMTSSRVWNPVSSVTEKVSEKAAETADYAKESFNGIKDSMTETFQESSNILTGSLSGMAHSVADTASSFVGNLKESLGFHSKSSTAYISAMEEKERQRRMNEKIDPLMEARKRHMELELTNKVKPAC